MDDFSLKSEPIDIDTDVKESKHFQLIEPPENLESTKAPEVKQEANEPSQETSTEIYTCNICSGNFNSEYMFNIHMNYIHSDAYAPRARPGQLSSQSGENGYVVRHLKRNVRAEDLRCTQCDTVFLQQGKFLKHLRAKHANNVTGFRRRKYMGLSRPFIKIASTGVPHSKHKQLLTSNSWSFSKRMETKDDKTAKSLENEADKCDLEHDKCDKFVFDEECDVKVFDDPLAGTVADVLPIATSKPTSNSLISVNLNSILAKNL